MTYFSSILAKLKLKLSDRIYHCSSCDLIIDGDMNAAINIRNMGLIKIGRSTPEFTPFEILVLSAMVTPITETGSPLRWLEEDVTDQDASSFFKSFKRSSFIFTLSLYVL